MMSAVSVMAEDYSNITGHYERYIDNNIDSNAAYIDVANHEHDKFQISGSALWVGNAENGNVNMGNIEGVFPLESNKIRYSGDECKLIVTFSEVSLIVSQDNLKCGGLNVSFNGIYKKVNKDH
jgi:hypothetical protein